MSRENAAENTKKIFSKEIKRIAKALEKAPEDVSKAEFFTNTEELSEWDIRKMGGFSGLKNLLFPVEVDLAAKHGTGIIRSHRNKLEKEYGSALFIQEEIIKEIKNELVNRPILLHKPVKTHKVGEVKRTLIACLSDTHFGANIAKKEMSGLNQYNWKIASRRLAYFAQNIANYKRQYRKETELVLQLNGDIIAGQIHNQEWFVDLLTDQFVGSLSILGQAISYLASEFPKVTVVCTPGNHGRNVGKSDRGRASTHKWDSYENMLYYALELQLTKHLKNVKFDIPQAPFAIYPVAGKHLVFQTHGDTVVNVGNPGQAISMARIKEQIGSINSSELVKASSKIAVLTVGHVHTPTVQMTDEGCSVVINGCMSGTDPFAQSIGIFANNPVQVMFEATEKHAVGDMRFIRLKEADKNEELEAIIKPYERIVDNS